MANQDHIKSAKRIIEKGGYCHGIRCPKCPKQSSREDCEDSDSNLQWFTKWMGENVDEPKQPYIVRFPCGCPISCHCSCQKPKEQPATECHEIEKCHTEEKPIPKQHANEHTYGPSMICGKCRASGCKGECQQPATISPEIEPVSTDPQEYITEDYMFEVTVLNKINELIEAINERLR